VYVLFAMVISQDATHGLMLLLLLLTLWSCLCVLAIPPSDSDRSKAQNGTTSLAFLRAFFHFPLAAV